MAARPLALAAAVTLLAGGVAGAQDAGDVGSSAIVSPTSNALVAIRRSEPRSEVALLVGAAVVEGPQVEGLARAVLELEGSWAPSRTWEIFATVNPVAYRWLHVAGSFNGQLALGSTTVGATWAPISLPEGRLAGGFFVRALLPTSQEVPGTHAWGLQAGLTLRGVATGWLAWFGGVSFRETRAWGSVTAWRAGASGTAGLALVPAPWFRLVGQVSGNVPFGGGSSQLSPGLGILFVQGSFGAGLGAVMPLLGPLRPFSVVARVSWRLDP
jgi:hypothetical protein